MRRVIYVILDGVGVGELPDAAEYGDEGSDTLGNLSRVVRLRVPFLQQLGLGNIAPIVGVAPTGDPLALVGRLASLSLGKDSTVGHWEQMGLVTEEPFPTYPRGFPPDIVEEFSRRIGRQVLGNRAASGTEIITRLGDEHVATGLPIVYTSADSVFQIAAHVEIVPLELLYSWCRVAREMLTGPHGVGRVIARPFSGTSGSYARTADRHDFSLPPHGATYLDRLVEAGVQVHALGKITDIFTDRGVTSSARVTSNEQNLALLSIAVGNREPVAESGPSLVISNLVDFDTAWGHRNDAEGFARGLEAADTGLARLAESLGPEDLLLVTADHGVDPTTPGTDHSREYVPVLLYPKPDGSPQAVYEGEFADAGATAFEYLTGRQADLRGRCILRCEPSRGWRRYTPAQASTAGTVAGLPGRVGPDEARAAGRWLADNLGAAPDLAVVLGSGLTLAGLDEVGCEVAYRAVPGWRTGEVQGHPYSLSAVEIDGRKLAFLRGRIHEYEGFDLSEVQMPIRSLKAWGVRKVVLTSAGGAVAPDLGAGDLVVVDRVLDLQYPDEAGGPVVLEGTAAGMVADLCASARGGSGRLSAGLHASVPGPQYETPAELHLLRTVGVATVSMTPAGELRAAHDEGMQVAVITVVTNAGETTHAEVLAAAGRAGDSLAGILRTLSAEWV